MRMAISRRLLAATDDQHSVVHETIFCVPRRLPQAPDARASVCDRRDPCNGPRGANKAHFSSVEGREAGGTAAVHNQERGFYFEHAGEFGAEKV